LTTGAQPATAAVDRASGLQNERPIGDGPNQPMGRGVGIHPGEVVWMHDPAATNERYTVRSSTYWFDPTNTNQEVVDAMLEGGVRRLTGADSVATAWNALFRSLNVRLARGDKGYSKGESIVIKINMNGEFNGKHCVNTSPQVCHALLDQLVHGAGVPENRIYLGDTNFEFDRTMYASVVRDYPKVRYWGKSFGSERPVASKRDVLFASDGGTSDPLPQAYLDATYVINVPVLKKHHRAGISLTAKNHFGTICPFNGNGAFNWHYSLPVPNGNAANTNGDYNQYRCLVDFMAHKDLGGKTVLFLVDGLWGSTNWGHPAIKWRMEPFSGDWPSSLFLSQDQVAIDSVGYDLLWQEFDPAHPTEGQYDPRDDSGPFSRYRGVDDYLHQAADPAKRPAGIAYDPERDGVPLTTSLGAHEHWNNPKDRQYSRNLGKSEGIELVYLYGEAGETQPAVQAAQSAPAVEAAKPTAPTAATTATAVGTPAAETAPTITGRVSGEFEDSGLFAASAKKKPAMKAWSEKEVWDAASGATIQTKTLGPNTGRGQVLLDGKVIAEADGFGQFWLDLPPGDYDLVGACRGYADKTVHVTVVANEERWYNFYLDRVK